MDRENVVLVRIYGRDGLPMFAPTATMDDPSEELWSIRQGARSLILHPFTAALELAKNWAAEANVEIYRQDTPQHAPTRFIPSA